MIIRDSEEMDDLKHEQEVLRQQLRDIKRANQNIKSALQSIAS
ncbi:hypothetical protein M975_0080 [Buttiauxella brennerae ATCC 51605]|uniref:Uncharacterized protein n=1 Tax=Buttiauxella brennerae ATCC 51605 TaxID=1354251 RepID=A0A1B7IX29_9ENTR|nr:hypothetical protein M975_0080 [Buttiauxella brennerae ATCC 51605]